MDAELPYTDSENGFWSPRPQESFPPPSICRLEEYRGQPHLALACTQTRLPDSEQRRIVKQWCEALPHLNAVRYLWFQSRVSQPLFDAACQLPALAGLYIKWSGIKDLSALAVPKGLKSLHLGHSARVTSLEPLARLKQLRWLELDGVKAVVDLESWSDLADLVGLGFSGAEFRRQTLPSFAPLARFKALRWLNLGALHSEDGSLAPLGTLTSLRFLNVANFFSPEQFASLSLQLPQTRCAWFAPYVSLTEAFLCTVCHRERRVLTSGRPGRILCPHCDARKFQTHLGRWQRALTVAGGASA